jgi:hypothetical protein
MRLVWHWRSAGLYSGSLGGTLAPQTKRALLRFQESNGLRRTAILDQSPADALIGDTEIGQGSSVPPKGTGVGSMENSSGTSDFGSLTGHGMRSRSGDPQGILRPF